MTKPFTIVGIGCGHRTQTYCGLAAMMPHRFQVVAGADPVAARVEVLRKNSSNPGFRGFASDQQLFAASKVVDLAEFHARFQATSR